MKEMKEKKQISFISAEHFYCIRVPILSMKWAFFASGGADLYRTEIDFISHRYWFFITQKSRKTQKDIFLRDLKANRFLCEKNLFCDFRDFCVKYFVAFHLRIIKILNWTNTLNIVFWEKKSRGNNIIYIKLIICNYWFIIYSKPHVSR